MLKLHLEAFDLLLKLIVTPLQLSYVVCRRIELVLCDRQIPFQFLHSIPQFLNLAFVLLGSAHGVSQLRYLILHHFLELILGMLQIPNFLQKIRFRSAFEPIKSRYTLFLSESSC